MPIGIWIYYNKKVFFYSTFFTAAHLSMLAFVHFVLTQNEPKGQDCDFYTTRRQLASQNKNNSDLSVLKQLLFCLLRFVVRVPRILANVISRVSRDVHQ
ncbi:hypothetical protein D0T56_01620 [Dysgonomonas sp. 520]|nr:hypothetical protein [Dysgonomonas sp. 520]